MRSSSSFAFTLSFALVTLSAIAMPATARGQAAQPAAPAQGTATQGAAASPSALIMPSLPLEEAAPPADAEKSPSGLASKVLRKGTGETRPGPADLATFHYIGWTASDGKPFDSSYRRRRPSTLFLDRVFPGMSEGVQLMVVGEKRRMWVPEALAFKGGEAGKPAGNLVLEIELVSFEPSPKVPPLDVMAPPADATKLPSGLAFRVLRPGTGSVSPRRSSTVTVHYTGWTTDGQMFDSSVMRSQPATFGLDEVIKGWTEGVSLMVEGEKRRFWIPARLAYGNQDGKPKGMLVFDIELIKIDKQ